MAERHNAGLSRQEQLTISFDEVKLRLKSNWELRRIIKNLLPMKAVVESTNVRYKIMLNLRRTLSFIKMQILLT